MKHIQWNNSQSHFIYLEPKQYLPEEKINYSTNGTWSVALNILASFKLEVSHTTNLALFFQYQDLRGKHRVPVDFVSLDGETCAMFSNLVQIPIRHSIDDVCLMLVGVNEECSVEVEALHIVYEEARSFEPQRTLNLAV